ncbi:MAG: hypothetical protein HQL40_05955 [Alphaproteobacteria bacterium]|nr:hypothetical protein [Alphaproteobacteria bacterium]
MISRHFHPQVPAHVRDGEIRLISTRAAGGRAGGVLVAYAAASWLAFGRASWRRAYRAARHTRVTLDGVKWSAVT